MSSTTKGTPTSSEAVSLGVGLAAAGGPHHEDVGLGGAGALEGRTNVAVMLTQGPFQGRAQPPVMKGDGRGEDLFALLLPDDEAVHLRLQGRPGLLLNSRTCCTASSNLARSGTPPPFAQAAAAFHQLSCLTWYVP